LSIGEVNGHFYLKIKVKKVKQKKNEKKAKKKQAELLRPVSDGLKYGNCSPFGTHMTMLTQIGTAYQNANS